MRRRPQVLSQSLETKRFFFVRRPKKPAKALFAGQKQGPFGVTTPPVARQPAGARKRGRSRDVASLDRLQSLVYSATNCPGRIRAFPLEELLATPYAGPIIDPHHHLWDLSLKRHPWLASEPGGSGGLGQIVPLRRNYLPQDYLADAKGQGVVATVHVEASWDAADCLGETRWLEALEKPEGVAARYVAHVPLADANAEALIEAQAAYPRVAGVRDILSFSADPARRFAARGDLMRDPKWRSGLRALGERGLVFDLMVYASQLEEAARLVRDFLDQTFVLEHCGSPIDRDAAGMQRWRDGLAEIARAPNVLIKITDPVAYDHAWTLASLREVVMRCIDCFGPQRAMFGSDFPVAGLWATFDEVYGAFKTIAAVFTPDEQRALFFANAARTYRVPVGASSDRPAQIL